MKLPEPGSSTAEADLFAGYLDYFRSEVRRKTADLDSPDLTTSQVPSGWTAAELVSHLVHMEQRWFVWGFLGEQVESPWGDQDAEGRWTTTTPLGELLDALDRGGERTTEILATHPLTTQAATGGRFSAEDPPPNLLGIAFHVLQEYARHTGHLDVARELIDGMIGEG
ncbi:MAG: Mini-circle protein [Aeromicrobium sp.]|nr:Mini-circle protein [Aeromicrobium sp.]